MTIGFEFPQHITGMSGIYEISTSIDAQTGTTTSSHVGGGIQLVDNVNCGLGVSLTDCMGTAQLPGETRYTLGISRNWYASPNLCWTSGNFGNDAPTSVTCPH